MTIPYGVKLANLGFRQAALKSQALAKGINVIGGFVTYKAVAEAHGYLYTPIESMIECERVIS